MQRVPGSLHGCRETVKYLTVMKRCHVVQMTCLSRVLLIVFVVVVTMVWFNYNLSLNFVIFFSLTVISFELYPCFLATFLRKISAGGVLVDSIPNSQN